MANEQQNNFVQLSVKGERATSNASSPDTGTQLDALRELQDGWYDGTGTAPDHSGLDWLSQVFDNHYPATLPIPRLCPTPAGGVFAEWSVGAWDLSLEIDLQERSGYWHALDLTTDADDEKELNLANPSDWQWLVAEIDGKRRSA